MPEILRLIRLVVLARLRSAGWAPWLLLAGWLVIASYQEPLLFRRYGIHLVDDAAWTGCLVVLLVLLLAERRLPRRHATAANLTLLSVMAILQAIAGYLADQSIEVVGVAARAGGAGLFFLAWAPLVITLTRNNGGDIASSTLHMIVVLAAGLMGSMLAVALRTSPDTFALMACALAIAGAACWASGRQTHT